MKIQVKLISKPSMPAHLLSNKAALTCYRPTLPGKDFKMLDLEKQIFQTGHHSVFSHAHFTFSLENIPVVTTILGLYFSFPFYNASHRSGRYCLNLYAKPDTTALIKQISLYWPSLNSKNKNVIKNYYLHCSKVFNDNFEKAGQASLANLKKERPHISEAGLGEHSRIAQEQLRVLQPLFFPAATYFTTSLLGLISLYHSAFSPDMRAVTDQMADIVTKNYPSLKFAFIRGELEDWTLEHAYDKPGIKLHPQYQLIDIQGAENFVPPSEKDWHPVDRLQYHPKFKDNSAVIITGKQEISLICMAQDQRHRTIRRSTAKLTGNMYVPPLLNEIGLAEEARNIYSMWLSMKNDLPPTLHDRLAPHGSMVIYQKTADANALIHESMKRCCWKAQEETYHLAAQASAQIGQKLGTGHPLLKYLQAPCVAKGSCVEGNRYCGRDIKQASIDINPLRRV